MFREFSQAMAYPVGKIDFFYGKMIFYRFINRKVYFLKNFFQQRFFKTNYSFRISKNFKRNNTSIRAAINFPTSIISLKTFIFSPHDPLTKEKYDRYRKISVLHGTKIMSCPQISQLCIFFWTFKPYWRSLTYPHEMSMVKIVSWGVIVGMHERSDIIRERLFVLKCRRRRHVATSWCRNTALYVLRAK